MAEEVGVLTGESTSHTGCFVFQTARKTKPIKARQPLNMKSLHRVRAVVSDEQDQKHKNHSDLTVEKPVGCIKDGAPGPEGHRGVRGTETWLPLIQSEAGRLLLAAGFIITRPCLVNTHIC